MSEDAETTTHGMNCPALGGQADCTCGLEWRIQLETEKTMHAAWRKRAAEAEQQLTAATARAEQAEAKSETERRRADVAELRLETKAQLVEHADRATERLAKKFCEHGEWTYSAVADRVIERLEQAEAACETERSLRVKAQACLARMRGTDFWDAMPEDERRYWNAEIQGCLKGDTDSGKSTADELRRLREFRSAVERIKSDRDAGKHDNEAWREVQSLLTAQPPRAERSE